VPNNEGVDVGWNKGMAIFFSLMVCLSPIELADIGYGIQKLRMSHQPRAGPPSVIK